jgi:ectonucleotide pyrophosphatase/phosphodiesterase family protein 4
LNGIATAAFGFPGSTAPIKGKPARYIKDYSREISDLERADWALQFFDWKTNAPRLILLYFDKVDLAGHEYGPEHDQVGKAMKQFDLIVNYIIQQLESKKVLHKVDILIVSDHGMSNCSTEKIIYLDDYIPADMIQVYDRGGKSAFSPVAAIHPLDETNVLPIYQKFKSLQLPITVYLKSEIPDRYHYNHRRVPEILLVANDTWLISLRALKQQGWSGGMHGYDYALPNMRGMFIANGPSFKKGMKVGSFVNVELYNIMCHVLGLKPAPNNGTFEKVKHMLNGY